MGQATSCRYPSNHIPPFTYPPAVVITEPVDLPAPPSPYLSHSQPFTLPIDCSPSSKLSPAVLLSVYQRAIFIYHLPLSSLSWKQWPGTDSSSPSYYSSLLTSEVSDAPPPTHVPLHPSDYLIRPSPAWFPHLLTLCLSLSLTVRFAPSAFSASLDDPYYEEKVTGSSPSLPHLLFSVPHLMEALRVYSRRAYVRMGLREVWLVEGLRYRGQEGWIALPSLPTGRLYFSCERIERVFLLSTLHHEMWHFIDHSYHSSNTLSPSLTAPLNPTTFCAVPDPSWSYLNPPSFRYTSTGRAPLSRQPTLSYSGEVPGLQLARGFVNRYAMVAMEEDRAEVWAALVRDRMSVREAEDEGIWRKGEELERRALEWSEGEMDERWWRRVQGKGGGGNFCLTRHERSVWGRLTRGRWQSCRDGEGVEYWHCAKTKQSVRINCNAYLPSTVQQTCIESACMSGTIGR